MSRLIPLRSGSRRTRLEEEERRIAERRGIDEDGNLVDSEEER